MSIPKTSSVSENFDFIKFSQITSSITSMNMEEESFYINQLKFENQDEASDTPSPDDGDFSFSGESPKNLVMKKSKTA